jgi:ribonucleoside-diphosphate reductase alpha chain
MSTVNIGKKIVGWRIKDNSSSSKDLIQNSQAPKRPIALKCEIHRATIKGEDWTILVGLLDDRPYEIIGGLSVNIEIPKEYKFGKLVKSQRKTVNARYDLHFGSEGVESVISDVVSVFDNPNNGSLTRMVSMCLRHGVPLQFIAEQLKKDKYSDMFSFSSVVSRVLKKYIEDGTGSGVKCDECKSVNLIYSGGCPVCQDCGYSKCG